jgi:hypothetical protein
MQHTAVARARRARPNRPPNTPELSILVPTRNEAGSLRSLTRRTSGPGAT